MKYAIRTAALLFLVLLLGTTAYAAEDCYTFTPPEGYTLVNDQAALWSNAAQTANINIIVEENDGVNPYDLSPEEIDELRDATSKAFSDGLAAYNGKVSNISAKSVTKCNMPALCIQLDSSYTIETLEMQSRQVQYIFFTKEHSIYITATVLTKFADADAELAAFEAAIDTLQLHDDLYGEATTQRDVLPVIVIIGVIICAAGGLALFLLRQRRKAAEEAAN